MFEEILESVRRSTSSVTQKIAFADFSPKRDWRIILSLSALITLAFILFDAYTFLRINEGETALGRDDTAVVTINRTLLGDVLEMYREKERNFEELKERVPAIIDPSL